MTDRERYRRLRELFHLVEDLTPEDREARLAEHCQEAPSIADEVRQLLAEVEEAEEEGYLNGPHPELAVEGETTLLLSDGVGGRQPPGGEGGPSPSRIIGGRYRLRQRLGKDAVGEVFRATHVGVKQSVAVRLILGEELGDRKALERFTTEAKALGRLRHPNIAGITDYGVDSNHGGVPYLVTELLRGRTLAEMLMSEGPLSMPETLSLLEGVAAGLDYAHRKGVVHGDLKPRSVSMCRRGGDRERIKILDFGLARLLGLDTVARPVKAGPAAGEDVPETGTTMASTMSIPGLGQPRTQAYMAPELAGGRERTVASDVFALGVIAYEALTQKLPFEPERDGIGGSIKEDGPKPPSALSPDLDPNLDGPILAALDADPGRRPASAGELVRLLRSALHRADFKSWVRREGPRRFVLAAVISAIAAMAALVVRSSPPVLGLDHRITDALFLLAAPRAPDPRIMIVVIDDRAVAARPRLSLSDREEEFASVLGSVLDAGAAGVGIDFVLPQRWRVSPSFGRFVVESSDRLVLAAFSRGAVTHGQQVEHGLPTVAIGKARTVGFFGFATVVEDPDGRVRRMRDSFVDTHGRAMPSFAARAAAILDPRTNPPDPTYDRRIDFTVDWQAWERVFWSELPILLEHRPGHFEGRLLLVGRSDEGSGDDHSVPHLPGHPEFIPEVILQALVVETILRGDPIRELAGCWVPVITLVTTFVLASSALLWPRHAGPNCAAAGLVGGSVGVFVLAFLWSQILVPLMVPVTAVVSTTLMTSFVRRRLEPNPGATAR